MIGELLFVYVCVGGRAEGGRKRERDRCSE